MKEIDIRLATADDLVKIQECARAAYSKYLDTTEFRDISVISKFGGRGLNTIRVDQYVDRALADGVMDLYLPDDTHWSDKGYELGARAVYDALTAREIIVEK